MSLSVTRRGRGEREREGGGGRGREREGEGEGGGGREREEEGGRNREGHILAACSALSSPLYIHHINISAHLFLECDDVIKVGVVYVSIDPEQPFEDGLSNGDEVPWE